MSWLVNLSHQKRFAPWSPLGNMPAFCFQSVCVCVCVCVYVRMCQVLYYSASGLDIEFDDCPSQFVEFMKIIARFGEWGKGEGRGRDTGHATSSVLLYQNKDPANPPSCFPQWPSKCSQEMGHAGMKAVAPSSNIWGTRWLWTQRFKCIYHC